MIYKGTLWQTKIKKNFKITNKNIQFIFEMVIDNRLNFIDLTIIKRDKKCIIVAYL